LDYHAFEERLEAAIHLRFGLPARAPAPIRTLIKSADRACAFFEATQLAGFSHAEALKFFGAPPRGYRLAVHALAPLEAEARYLQRFEVLSQAAGYAGGDAAFDTE